MDDTEPPLDSPGISPGSGHSRSLQLICHFDNKHENIRRFVYIHINCKHFSLTLMPCRGRECREFFWPSFKRSGTKRVFSHIF